MMQFLGGGEHLHGFLAAECPGYAFFLLFDGTHTGGTSRHFGQVVHQEAVRLVLTGKYFRQVKQVGFLFCQEGAQGVYLCRTYIVPTMRFQGLQQAVGAQTEDAVTGAVGFFPPDDTFAEGDKPSDVAVGGVDVVAHLPYLGGLGFYLSYPLPFMH